MKTLLVCLLSAAVILGAGCTKTKDAEPSRAGETRPGNSEEADSLAPASEGRERPAPQEDPTEALGTPSVDELAARALLTEWLRTQNEGDFEAYATLYATRFSGIKRSGPRVHTYNRQSWLGDRKKMFARAMYVGASNVRVTAGRTTTEILFEQTWRSSTYEDAGPKRLVLVQEDAQARIAREEMLSSNVARSTAGQELLQNRFVVQSSQFVVLQTSIDEGAATAQPQLARVEDPVTTLRPMNGPQLPRPLAVFEGRTIELFSAEGLACTMQIKKLYAMQQYVPHFAERESWKEERGSGSAETAPSASWRKKIAKRSWDPQRVTSLVTTIPRDGRCPEVFWARLQDAPASSTPANAPRLSPRTTSYPRVDLTANDVIEVRRAVTGSPLYATLKEEQKANPESPWNLIRDAEIHRYASDEPGGRAFLLVQIDKGSGCGDMTVRYRALFESRDGAMQLLFERDSPLQVSAIVDMEGQGDPALIVTGFPGPYETTVLKLDGTPSDIASAVQVPFNDCPC